MKKFLLVVGLVFFSGSVFAKCTSGDCVNGFGTYQINGGKYVGEFKNSLFEGQGTFTSDGGRSLVAEFKDGQVNGQGTLTFANGNKYVGEFKNGIFEGQGIFTWFNGDKYVGEFKNDQANGQGTYTFARGGKYIGEFKNYNRNGQGAFFYPDGKIENGIWFDGKFMKANNINIKSIEEDNEVVKVENEKKLQEQTTKVVTVKKNNLDKKSLKEELQYWKELFEDELITKAEYDQKRKELLEGGVKVTQEATKNETKIVKPKNTNNIKTVTVDMKYKNKNYLNNSLLNQKKWSKISNYCDAKYNTFWEYQECEAQNTKAYKMYNKAKNIYDIYISYGELLSYQALAGEISQQQARYYYESKRNELEDAYNKNKSTKWNNFVNNMLKIQQYSNSLNNNTKPPSFNSHRTCTISSWRGGTVADISCH